MLYFPWRFQRSRVVNCKLGAANSTLSTIREWVIEQTPSFKTSTHWWYNDLPPHIKGLFCEITMDTKITGMFKKLFGDDYKVDVIHQMNEIYVSPPSNNNADFVKNASDNIFFTRHIDGPLFNIPFASCYRVIVGLDDNRDIMTVFNMSQETYMIKTGDVVGFDFHRECHYISPVIWNSEDTPAILERRYRVILKIHYCVYPYWAIAFGFIVSNLSILYNKLFRNLFLFTLIPQSKYTTYLAKYMVLSTQAYHDIEFYIGYNNIQYLLLLTYISSNLHQNVFLFGSSFVHYLRWIDTEYYGSNYNNIFRRDYYFFKLLYMLQFYRMYFSYYVESPSIYTLVIVPPLFASCVLALLAPSARLASIATFTPKVIELYMMYSLLNNNILKYTEYIYLFMNIYFNYIQLRKPITIALYGRERSRRS